MHRILLGLLLLVCFFFYPIFVKINKVYIFIDIKSLFIPLIKWLLLFGVCDADYNLDYKIKLFLKLSTIYIKKKINKKLSILINKNFLIFSVWSAFLNFTDGSSSKDKEILLQILQEASNA